MKSYLEMRLDNGESEIRSKIFWDKKHRDMLMKLLSHRGKYYIVASWYTKQNHYDWRMLSSLHYIATFLNMDRHRIHQIICARWGGKTPTARDRYVQFDTLEQAEKTWDWIESMILMNGMM